jgi:hypothetical protein
VDGFLSASMVVRPSSLFIFHQNERIAGVQSRKAYIPLRDRDAVRFSEFLEQSGLGRSKGYELLNTGQVETFVVGKARFVVVQSWLDFIDRQRQAQQVFKPNWHPPGRPRRNSAPNDGQPASAPAAPANLPVAEAPMQVKRARGRPRKVRGASSPSEADAQSKCAP